MPRVVLATAYGGPEVLSVVDEPIADPGPGEVRVRVRAAGVNPIDAKVYSGAFGTDPSRLPFRLGGEISGEVVAAGPDTGFSAGDEVIGYRVDGGYADELLAPAPALVPKPPSLGWEEAAGLCLTGATAFHTLTATGVGAGDTVLVHGAAGGVGLMAVQLAKIRGARAIGTASLASHDLLRELGAEPVAYGPGLADRVRALASDGVDAAVDAIGTDEAMDVSLALVADRARIATVVSFVRGTAEGVKVLGGGPGGDPGTELRAAARTELAELAGSGRIRVVIDGRYSLADVADAHRQLTAGHTHGKIVLVP
jgi:NADPH:quinone reductase-like Zn-dependent oxidoreductase